MIQKINVSKGQVLTRENIKMVLDSARSNYQYARFNLPNGIYLNVTYNRDQTIEISTNSRRIDLYQQIVVMRRSYTQIRLVTFMFRWINLLSSNG